MKVFVLLSLGVMNDKRSLHAPARVARHSSRLGQDQTHPRGAVRTLSPRSFADLAVPEPQPGGDVSPVTLYATTG
jgi:hypothetical protein